MDGHVKRWFRDWRRGYRDKDIASAREKLSRLSPFDNLELTKKEWKALKSVNFFKKNDNIVEKKLDFDNFPE